MKTFLHFIIAACLCVSAAVADPPKQFAVDDYLEHRRVLLDILKTCPPSECVYVGLGRSPTVYTAMLENIAPDSVVNLPLAFKRDPITRDVLPPKPAEKAEIMSHLDNFLPDAKTLGGKRVMVIDYVVSGKSLIQGTQLIDEHYKKSGQKVEVDVYPFGYKDFVEEFKVENKKLGYKMYGYEDSGAPGMGSGKNAQWFNQSWDDHAKYESFRAGETDSKKLTPRDPYARLKSETAGYLAADPDPTIAKYRKGPARSPALADGAGGAASNCKFNDILKKYRGLVNTQW